MLNAGQTDTDILGQKGSALDETNLRILSVLRDNGRISMAALAERVNISRASAYNRVEQMTATGVITGFSATIDPRLVGLDISALVFVTVHPQSWHRFREGILQMPDVEYCSITTGEHDAMLLIRAVDITGVHDFVTGVVSIRPEVKSVVSVVVLDEIVRRSFLLPTDIPVRESETNGLGMTRFTRVAEGRGEMARG
ncbi:Lrp/AsnC family transcriptional regulator [Glaciihabitans sp. dw_435]|uniref:Lrp/AsnC family transcriptional regulator n=1 Tax=Glaciihabitans sp. dw_435 TaxID=2720081 RepID=UPI001BD673F5|nr:Lrp/AsnC family transcriptional regulator [Glaciihabitans sp. dw_435]